MTDIPSLLLVDQSISTIDYFTEKNLKHLISVLCKFKNQGIATTNSHLLIVLLQKRNSYDLTKNKFCYVSSVLIDL